VHDVAWGAHHRARVCGPVATTLRVGCACGPARLAWATLCKAQLRQGGRAGAAAGHAARAPARSMFVVYPVMRRCKARRLRARALNACK